MAENRAGSAVSWDDGRSGLGAALRAESDPLPSSHLCAVPDGHDMPVPGGLPAGGPESPAKSRLFVSGAGDSAQLSDISENMDLQIGYCRTCETVNYEKMYQAAEKMLTK